jgi:hypothetical protein
MTRRLDRQYGNINEPTQEDDSNSSSNSSSDSSSSSKPKFPSFNSLLEAVAAFLLLHSRSALPGIAEGLSAAAKVRLESHLAVLNKAAP